MDLHFMKYEIMNLSAQFQEQTMRMIIGLQRWLALNWLGSKILLVWREFWSQMYLPRLFR